MRALVCDLMLVVVLALPVALVRKCRFHPKNARTSESKPRRSPFSQFLAPGELLRRFWMMDHCWLASPS